MPLTAGLRLGSYEIVRALGAGGMGEVYRARDTQLNRDVAIKVLPEAFAADADRLARFTREAQVLAALNHPNIAAIYGIEGHALVMELVEGEDLSAHVARGALPLADALPVARQIAEALEAAHEAGIVHRDLKPANIKVRTDGTVKVLDFGLAKAMGSPGSEDPGLPGDAANSPTLTARATQMGMIIGTAAYMAPEQAKGRAVDKRADIWAFGVVLYEMLTGRRAFEGEDVSTTLAAVLMKDPEWTALPKDLPPGLRTLVRRCLERDPKARLRDIGEARLLLSNPEAMSAGPASVAPVRTSRLPWFVAAAGVLAAAFFAVVWLARPGAPAAGGRIEASLAPPPGHAVGSAFALSPDGRRLVMEAVTTDTGATSLWLRDLASGATTKLPGTDGATLPFWSPAGTEIAFFADGKLKKTDLQGSPPQVVCDAPTPRGGAWGPDGTIVFAGSARTGLERVDAAGGKPVVLTTLDSARREKSHRWPVFLPDGGHLLFVAQTGEATSKDDASTIEALALGTGARTRLVVANSSPLYSAAGYLLFWREDALRAQAFDANRLVVSGPVFSVAPGVAFDANEHVQASVSPGGALVYSTANATSRADLLLVDRTGRPVKSIAESLLIEGGAALSHDGTRLAAAVTADGARDANIWVFDLVRDTSGPLTFDEGAEFNPVWSFDDAHVIYSNSHKNDGTIFNRPANGQGQPEEVASHPSGLWSWGVSKDGRWLLVGGQEDATGLDLLRYDVADQKLTPLVSTAFDDDVGALSPDERWLAYQSDEAGRPEIYVRSLGADAGRWRISSQGGWTPLWRADGRELYFVSPQGQMMAVDIDTQATFRAAAPRELFRANFDSGRRARRGYAVMADGQRFAVHVLKERGATLLTLVTNWTTAVPSSSRGSR